jgi:hypothetical protein
MSVADWSLAMILGLIPVTVLELSKLARRVVVETRGDRS